MPSSKYAAYEGRPGLTSDLVRAALGDLVTMASTFSISSLTTLSTRSSTNFPGWPRVVRGRADLMAQFAAYGDNIRLQVADKLITHKMDDGRVVVIEYDSPWD